MSPSCRCHPPVRSSTQPRTSGSICDRPISPTVCSRPTPTSSTPAKTPGENFSPKPGASPRSRLATGPSSVRSSEGWYNQPCRRHHECKLGDQTRDDADKEPREERSCGRSQTSLYNETRTHLALNKDAPVSRLVQRTGV